LIAGVRAGHGLLLLVRPQASVGRLLGRQLTRGERVVARVLGVRQLGQALASAAVPSAAVVETGAGIDAVHALSMVALGVASRRHRRAALASAGVAASFATAGVLAHWSATAARTASKSSGIGSRQRRK
jgi:hypothetical protein